MIGDQILAIYGLMLKRDTAPEAGSVKRQHLHKS